MNKKAWSVTQEMETVHLTRVFSGGACNILNVKGELLRNTERDPINDWLTEKGVQFFDPQIHPDTHSCEYDYTIHNGLEKAARHVAKINLYEVSPRTFGGITSLELASDHFRWLEPIIIYFSDGESEHDGIPHHSKEGYPLFAPYGLNTDVMSAHYREMVKNANNMRKYLISFANEMSTMTVNFSDHPYEGDIVVTPDRMHAADLFRAVVTAASGHRVFVNFTGGTEAKDEAGNPLFVPPVNPSKVQTRAMLDQYVDEGTALRQAIAELVRINVYVRVVYTQRSAILALEEVLRMKKVIS